MPGALELWLLSPKVPSFDEDSPWFETAQPDEEEPLPLLHPLPSGRRAPPSSEAPSSEVPSSEAPSTQRSRSEGAASSLSPAASSLSPAALSLPPSSVQQPGRQAPSSLVVVGFLAIAVVAAIWMAHDDDPSRDVPALVRDGVAQPPTPSPQDPAVARAVGAANREDTASRGAEREPGSLRGPFNSVAAATSLSAAVAKAAGCTARPPRTEGRVSVTFSPSGQVSAVTFDRQPAASASASQLRCVTAALRASSVPPFDGQPVKVTVRVPLLMPLQNEPPPPEPMEEPYPSND